MNEEIIELEIYPEFCCDRCLEIIHNHFDCPVCKMEYASSNVYGDLEDDEIELDISCENCHSKFERISEKWYEDCKIKIIKNERADLRNAITT